MLFFVRRRKQSANYCFIVHMLDLYGKFDLKTTSFSKLARIDPKNNPHLCFDMIYRPAKFDVDWLKETQVIVKKLMFDARPTTNIPNLITRFHLVKTWLMKTRKYVYLELVSIKEAHNTGTTSWGSSGSWHVMNFDLQLKHTRYIYVVITTQSDCLWTWWAVIQTDSLHI